MSDYTDQLRLDTASNEYDCSVFKQFVALGGECLRDGDMFGAVVGDLPTGCAAFEKTRAKAVLACMHNFYNEDAKSYIIKELK